MTTNTASATTSTFDLDTLLLKPAQKAQKPAWLKQARQNVGFCASCHTQYGKAELNAQKHCRHCADELGEAHPLNS